MGRPSTYSPELGAAICERIALGDSFRTISADDDMPAVSTMLRWLSQVDDFREHYTRAKEQCSDLMAEDIVDIADKEPDPARARVRVDARKWIAAKLKPKKYGDRQTLEHEGAVNLYVLRAPEPAKDANEWLESTPSSGSRSPVPRPTS